MTDVRFAILRHAPTEWNESRRLQGMTDISLSAEGEALARSWRLPAPACDWRRICSPLVRARRTAELLHPPAPATVERRLREMSFGVWEGRTVAELRATIGASFLDAEGRGLDFQPPGGESPRATMARLSEWASEIATASQPVVAISHKAAIRALLALATGWDMTGRQPVKLDWQRLHYFVAQPNGAVAIDKLNVALERA